jgi:spore coat polysaccharide biosynthesis predicted glycosyltransferase SpsG
MKRLILRADAHAAIGAGHLLRCLALAQAWREAGGEVTFVAHCDSPSLWARLDVECVDVVRLF